MERGKRGGGGGEDAAQEENSVLKLAKAYGRSLNGLLDP